MKGVFFVKKYLTVILAISMLALCSCKTDKLNSSESTQTSEIDSQITELTPLQDDTASNEESVETGKNNISTDSQTESTQNQKTVINVNTKTAKMSFRGSNDNISTVEKEYIIDKASAFEKYTKSNMQNKTVNILGVEHKDVPYYQSKKYQYTGKDYDIFKNDKIEIDVLSTGDVIKFSTEEPIRIFEGEYKHSEELAKKYLEKIFPSYKYDNVKKYEIAVTNQYIYKFFKSIDGIRTSDSISITLNSYGELRSYRVKDNGKYDNIEIKNFNIDDFLQRVDKYVEDAFGNVLIDYSIFEEGPHYNIFTDDKVELTIPIVVNVKGADGAEYSITEDVVFELN